MWYTEKPDLLSAKKPRGTEEQNKAPPAVWDRGSATKAKEATTDPIAFKTFQVLVADKILLVIKWLAITPPIFENMNMLR